MHSPASSAESINVGVSSRPPLNDNPVNSDVEFNLDDIVADPGLRKPVEDFDVRVRDRIQREYFSKGPCQLYGFNFPKRTFGFVKRSFRDDWFNKFSWLEYSVSKDAAFCFWCYLFKDNNTTRFGNGVFRLGNDAFTKTGFRDWKKALERFREHAGGANSMHNKARRKFQEFENQLRVTSGLQLKETPDFEADYRIRLKTALGGVRFLLRQGLSFGNHDLLLNSNRGNFVEFVEWFSELSTDVRKLGNHNDRSNDQFTSHIFQKKMVEACADETRLAILADIGDKKFSLLFDTSFEISDEEPIIPHEERLTIVLRYVNAHGEVVERLLATVGVTEYSLEFLKNVVDSLFAKYKLSLSRLRGQGHGETSNCLRAELNDLKSLILKENCYAKFFHCFAHDFRLVVASVAMTCPYACQLFLFLEKIVQASGFTYKTVDKLRKVEHDQIVERLENWGVHNGKDKTQETESVGRGYTRWGSQFNTLLRLHSMWPSVIEIIDNLYYGGTDYRDDRRVILILIDSMEDFGFVFVLHLMKYILGITDDLSKAIQQRDQNITQVIHLIDVAKAHLQELRRTGWEKVLKETENFCVAYSIPVPNMEDVDKRLFRNRGEEKMVSNYHHFHVEIYCKVLDLIVQEIENRFSESTLELLLCIACLDPRDSFSKFNVDKLVCLAQLYPEDFSCMDIMMLPHQLETCIHDIRKDNQFSTIQDLGNLSKKMVETGKDLAFPLVYRLVELALLLPVGVASIERLSSKKYILKADLLKEIRDEWKDESLLVFLEREVFATVKDETILQRFQMQNIDTQDTSGDMEISWGKDEFTDQKMNEKRPEEGFGASR